MSVKVPNTYAEWVTVLDMLKNKEDDEAVLEAMLQGTIEWQVGVAERFAKRLIDTINERMNSATEKFQKEINRSQGQERALIQALVSLRKELKFLSQAIHLPALPEKDREHYYNLVKEQADKIQESLEDSAKHDRTGKLASLIRNNKVNNF